MKLLCDIYKSPKDNDMYLYVKKQEGLERVPEALIERFGKPTHVMTLVLTPGKKLARVSVEKLIEQLDQSGFYLQLPPQPEAYMQAVNEQNSKLAK
ncbi:YcgL domain-containing protein [Maricurvus nonylphenolicus]|uniref:YcgL domain-containing protein n=1 Tax=Maricurvus nonylphenolicus TaxID=1008307 RepID=UPI0036F35DCC